MSAKPTGRLVHREDGLYLMLNRLFNAPIEQVWASMTRPLELEKWIGIERRIEMLGHANLLGEAYCCQPCASGR